MTMTMRLGWIGVWTLLSATGCGMTSGGGDGDVPGQDLAMAGGDGAMMGGGDGGGDGATGQPDLAASTQAAIGWALTDCMIGGMQCGFAVTCGQAGVTSLTITVLNAANPAMKRETKIPCPKDDKVGNAMIDVPDQGGSYNLVGVADGKPKSKGLYVCGSTKDNIGRITIFVDGCDIAKCMGCM